MYVCMVGLLRWVQLEKIQYVFGGGFKHLESL